jgi:uncharacterized protein YggE
MLTALSLTVPCTYAAEPEPRVVNVSGQGESRGPADVAFVTLGVASHAPTVEPARQATNEVVARLLKIAHELSIPEKDVRSTALVIGPDMSYSPKHEPTIVGYHVRRQVQVELKDLGRLGNLLEKAVTAGANEIQPPRLDSTRRAELEREALAAAVADARKNADVIARGLNASVGAPRNVSSGGPVRPLNEVTITAQRAAVAGASAEAPESYQGGELSFQASVNASFDLIPGRP